MARRKDPVLPETLLDRLLGGVDAKSAFDGGGRIEALTQALAGRALNAERDRPLLSEGSSGNGRNGYEKKTVLTEDGSLEPSIPRDRPSVGGGGALGRKSFPVFAFPKDVRRIVYPTNALEALNSKRRRAVARKGPFPLR